jgi:acyl-CoA reductase-like NAD-dependent aldehyde dehydrogenase
VLYEGAVPAGLHRGYYVGPVVVDNVTKEMRIFKEEVFGPVLCVSTFNTFEEAVELTNAVEFGLTGSIFTENVSTAMQFIEQSDMGMIHVNEATIGGEAQLPFGGWKATAVGDKELGKDGVEFFTHTKTVYINFSDTAERTLIR